MRASTELPLYSISIDTGMFADTGDKAPSLHACHNCPVNFVCCSVSSKGGIVEPPYLMPSDITSIADITGEEEHAFVENRVNPLTGNVVAFVSPSNGPGCRFHDINSGRCRIYEARPIDCRLYPLDIMLIESRYYWILWKYCELGNEDLLKLLRYGESLLPMIKDHIHDYATVPLDVMDSSPYDVVAVIEF